MAAEREGLLFNRRGRPAHTIAVGLMAIGLAALVFYVDTFTSIEGAIAVLYVVVLLLGSEILTRIGLLMVVLLCIALAIISYAVAHGDVAELQTFLRLAVALAALAITFALLVRSERFRAELIAKNAAIRDSEFRYRSIFDRTRVALWERDYSQVRSFILDLKAQGTTDLLDYARLHPETVDSCIDMVRTVAANEAARELLDLGNGNDTGIFAGRFLASGDKTFLGIMDAIFQERGYFEGKGTITTASGEKKLVLLSISFPEDPKSFDRVIVGMVDITQSEQIQMALVEARAELTRASKAATVGALSASLAHELNQPLGAIVVNAQTLIRWLDRDPPDLDAVRRSADRMIRDSKRASDIIQNTRSMLSDSEQKAEWVNLPLLIGETKALMDDDLQRDSVEVEILPSSGVPLIRSVRIEIQQVLINLISNAIQAISGDNAVVRKITIGTQLAGSGQVSIVVRDSGPGITEEAAPKLFAPFYTTKASGMGMGLSICRSALESRGGRLEGHNHPSGGAVFEITLPINDET